MNLLEFMVEQGADYCCIINGMKKNDAVNLLQNANLTEGRGEL